jgi:small subunit ribosomal protein S2
MTKTSKKESNFSIALKDLLEAGSHFGHQSKRWNPKMEPYIWKSKDGVHIFDLAVTAQKLQEACLAVRDLVASGGVVVFVGTKRQAEAIIKEEAEKIGAPYVTYRWLGGTITNWPQIKKSIDKLKDMQEKQKSGEYEKYTKKENILLQREINRLKKLFGGLKDLKKEPDGLFIIDTCREESALKEAEQKGIKTFAMIDSNADPDLVDYVIPANDDAVRSIKLIVETFAKAVQEGLELQKKGGVKKQEKQEKRKEDKEDKTKAKVKEKGGKKKKTKKETKTKKVKTDKKKK